MLVCKDQHTHLAGGDVRAQPQAEQPHKVWGVPAVKRQSDGGVEVVEQGGGGVLRDVPRRV